MVSYSLLSRWNLIYQKPNSTLGMTLKKYTTEFSPFIWFTVLFYLISAILLMNIFSKIQNEKSDLSESFLFVVGSICNLSGNKRPICYTLENYFHFRFFFGHEKMVYKNFRSHDSYLQFCDERVLLKQIDWKFVIR